LSLLFIAASLVNIFNSGVGKENEMNILFLIAYWFLNSICGGSFEFVGNHYFAWEKRDVKTITCKDIYWIYRSYDYHDGKIYTYISGE
jgi:hypothetical protein